MKKIIFCFSLFMSATHASDQGFNPSYIDGLRLDITQAEKLINTTNKTDHYISSITSADGSKTVKFTPWNFVEPWTLPHIIVYRLSRKERDMSHKNTAYSLTYTQTFCEDNRLINGNIIFDNEGRLQTMSTTRLSKDKRVRLQEDCQYRGKYVDNLRWASLIKLDVQKFKQILSSTNLKDPNIYNINKWTKKVTLKPKIEYENNKKTIYLYSYSYGNVLNSQLVSPDPYYSVSRTKIMCKDDKSDTIELHFSESGKFRQVFIDGIKTIHNDFKELCS